MTDKQKLEVIDAIISNWYGIDREQNAVGTLHAIGAVLSMGDEPPKKEYTGIFDEFFKGLMPPKDNGDKGNV